MPTNKEMSARLAFNASTTLPSFFLPSRSICVCSPVVGRRRVTQSSPTMKLFRGSCPLNEIDRSRDNNNNNNNKINDAVAISGQLKGAIQRLYAAHITPEGVDYNAMKSSNAFADYVTAAGRLPDLNLEDALPNDTHKLAFFINLYNAATQHAITVRGPPPSSSLGRLRWGMRTVYHVGDFWLSLHEMENGILRKNRRISVIPPPFGIFDSRKKLCVEKLDPRIHFVLNCAASSCPPVLFLTVENLEAILKMATRGFLKNKENFYVLGDTVYLSMIFNWYREDFSSDNSDLSIFQYVCKNADESEEDIVTLKHMIKECKERKRSIPDIKWLPYDWTLNSV